MKILLLSDLHYGYDQNTRIVLTKFYKSIINKETFDIIVITGDINSHKQSTFESAIKHLREYFKQDTILIVKGNHDWWDTDELFTKIDEIELQQREILKKYRIIDLEEVSMYISYYVGFIGLMGWYGMELPPTNDKYNIPEGLVGMNKLAWKKEKALEKVKLSKNFDNLKKRVVVTHFGFDPVYGYSAKDERVIFDNADIVLYGHSHIKDQRERGEVKVYNCGSDYNDPKYLIIEV